MIIVDVRRQARPDASRWWCRPNCLPDRGKNVLAEHQQDDNRTTPYEEPPSRHCGDLAFDFSQRSHCSKAGPASFDRSAQSSSIVFTGTTLTINFGSALRGGLTSLSVLTSFCAGDASTSGLRLSISHHSTAT